MLKINCDLGEGLDNIDAAIMPLIDQASIACGAHAGDEPTMRRSVLLAKQYNVQVGAHPSYPDRKHFGRRSLHLPKEFLVASLYEQITCLLAHCNAVGVPLVYVKPHGALYHDMNASSDTFNAVLIALDRINKQLHSKPLLLMVQGNATPEIAIKQAEEKRVALIFEGFADRAYTDSGQLVSRVESHAMLTTTQEIESQVKNFVNKGGVYTENGKWLSLSINSLCVHGDTVGAVALVQSARRALNEK